MTNPLVKYKKAKLNMLKKEFKFNLTAEEEQHINELESEIAIDNYCHKIFNKYLRN